MLSSDRIAPLLLHDDRDVRGFAAEYLSDSYSDDPRLMPMVIDACERFGAREDRHNLYLAARFTMDERSLDRLLDLAAGTDHEPAVNHINEVVSLAPIAVAEGRWEAIAGCPKITAKTRTRLERRRDYGGWSGERLWNELQDFARRCERDFGPGDDEKAEDLVEALGRGDVPDAEIILRPLKEAKAEYEWLDVFLVDLAGRRRLREAVPVLVDLLHNDGDYLLEACSNALARINDPEAASLIRQAYPDASLDFQITGVGVLGKLKHPESEAAVLALLDAETRGDYRIWLASALCDLFSERAVEVGLREVEKGGETFLQELAQPVSALALVFNTPPSPLLDALARERKRQHEAAKQLEDDDLLGRIREFVLGGARLAVDEEEEEDAEEVTARRPPTQPIRNAEPRVGRNDPCPCGSAKKFKKCCGRSG